MAVDTLGLVAKSGLTLALVSRPAALGRLGGLPPALVFSLGQLALAAVTLLGYGAYGLRLLRAVRPGTQHDHVSMPNAALAGRAASARYTQGRAPRRSRCAVAGTRENRLASQMRLCVVCYPADL